MSAGWPVAAISALHHDDRKIGDAEHDVCELLDHEDRDAGVGDVAHQAVELLDDEGGEAHRHLVEEQDGRLGHERPRHRQHSLLAARQRSGQL